jgi:hypothetical protein
MYMQKWLIGMALGLTWLLASCTSGESETKDPVGEEAEEVDEDLITLGERREVEGSGNDDMAEAEVIEEQTIEQADDSVPTETSAATQKTQQFQGGMLYYVKAQMANVRKNADKNSDVIAKLEKGARVHVKGINGDWAELTSGGFIKADLLSKGAVGINRKPQEWKHKQ